MDVGEEDIPKLRELAVFEERSFRAQGRYLLHLIVEQRYDEMLAQLKPDLEAEVA